MMRKISTFFQNNEKWLIPTALFGGFIIDNLTLRRADLLVENLLLAFYFIIVFTGVLVWHKFETRKEKSITHLEIQSLIFVITQFVFGGLFSSLAVFYIKSASLIASWPFLLILFGGMIAVEYLKKHFTQFIVQLSTLYILLFTYLIILVPLVVRAINNWVFLLSGIVSLILVVLYVFLFEGFVPSLIRNKYKVIFSFIGGIFLIINLFYFTNIIPPAPLILKESGIYKQIMRNDNDYKFVNYPERYSFKDLKKIYTVSPNTVVYFYSSIYAPVKFKQNIVHEWQKKNLKGEWVSVSTIGFRIYGGNTSGYRGYTVSGRVDKGEWRVLVKTKEGKVLGSESFIVE